MVLCRVRFRHLVKPNRLKSRMRIGYSLPEVVALVLHPRPSPSRSMASPYWSKPL